MFLLSSQLEAHVFQKSHKFSFSSWIVTSFVNWCVVCRDTGDMLQCSDFPGIEITREWCQNHTEYRWTNQKVNFDNVMAGYLALFQVVSAISLVSRWIVSLFPLVTYVTRHSTDCSCLRCSSSWFHFDVVRTFGRRYISWYRPRFIKNVGQIIL